MPKITIEITECQEAAIRDRIDKRYSFAIDGGRVVDSDGEAVFMESIAFRFRDSEHNQSVEEARTGQRQ